MINPAKAALVTLILCTRLCAAEPSPAKEPATVTVGDLAWLSGDWVEQRGDLRIEEKWYGAEAGTLLGTGRQTRQGKTIFVEFLKIEEREGAIVYAATIPKSREVVFRLTRNSPGEVLFENPRHDFP